MELSWLDILKAVGITTAGGAITALLIGFLSQRLFDHLLKSDLQTHENSLKTALTNHKAELDTELETHKNNLKGELETRKHTLETELETHKNQLETALTNHKAELDKDFADHEASLRRMDARGERVRSENSRWANPIIDAVTSLKHRLKNILDDDASFALDKNSKPIPGWDITYDYFMPSSVFLFAQFFCWQRLLEESLGFDLFDENTQKDNFIKAVRAVGQPLNSWPLEEMEKPEYLSDKEWGQFIEQVTNLPEADNQVFHFEQRAIGETLMLEKDARPVSMRYPAFLAMWNDGARGATFTPLRNFLEGVKPGTRRWKRLELVQRALSALEDECQRVLSPRK
jgi:hypothetical protein